MNLYALLLVMIPTCSAAIAGVRYAVVRIIGPVVLLDRVAERCPDCTPSEMCEILKVLTGHRRRRRSRKR